MEKYGLLLHENVKTLELFFMIFVSAVVDDIQIGF